MEIVSIYWFQFPPNGKVLGKRRREEGKALRDVFGFNSLRTGKSLASSSSITRQARLS